LTFGQNFGIIKKIVLLLILFLPITSYASAFLKIKSCDAYLSTTLHRNPAVLATLDERTLLFERESRGFGISRSLLLFAHPFTSSALSLSFSHLTIPKIEKRKGKRDEPEGFCEAEDIALRIGFSKFIRSTLSAGAILCYLRESLGGYTADSYSADIGLLYQRGRIRAGLAVKNIGTELRFIQKGYQLPLMLSVGLSFKRERLRIGSAADFEKRVRFNVGTEYLLHPFSIRAGVSFRRELRYSVGAGVRFGSFKLDYCFTSCDLNTLHRATIAFSFKKPGYVEIEDIQIFDIFPSKSMYYCKNPIGRLVVKNTTPKPAKLRISLYLPKVMEYPYIRDTEVAPDRG
jgi:hypothetical protein